MFGCALSLALHTAGTYDRLIVFHIAAWCRKAVTNHTFAAAKILFTGNATASVRIFSRSVCFI